ncbi:MAG: methionine--tRNA ligase, partial [Candidatus Krumholzibacteria bacterium]|nr:methionine--tRNA ligase [Candidatus Krumholzibacteria bacterium]
RKPWAQAKAGDDEALDVTLRVLLEVLRLCSILCQPFMPEKARQMREQLELPADFAAIRLDEAAAPGEAAWRRVGAPEVLFPKLEAPV